MSQPATVTSGHRSRWWLAAAAAALLIVAAVVGVARPGSFVVLGWLNRPFLFGSLALGLLALACWLAPLGLAWRLLVAGLLTVGALAWAAAGWLLGSLLSDDLSELSRLRSPDGARELRLYRGTNIIDPTWELRLRSGSGLTEREWDLGCVNSDIETLSSVEWTGPERLRIHLSRRGPVDIVVDNSTGRPNRQLSVGC